MPANNPYVDYDQEILDWMRKKFGPGQGYDPQQAATARGQAINQWMGNVEALPGQGVDWLRNKIQNWWSPQQPQSPYEGRGDLGPQPMPTPPISTGGGSGWGAEPAGPTLDPEVQRRYDAATKGIIPTWLQGVGGDQSGYTKLNANLPQPAPALSPAEAPDYGPQPGYTPMGPPPMAPEAPPPGPPPPQQQAPQIAGGMPGVDPAAYMQAQEDEKRQRYMQMVQFVNSLMGPQGEEKPSRKEKIANALMPLSAMMTQFGGAMLTPAWARGNMLANMGNIIPEYMFAQQKGRADREARRDTKMLGMMPALMKIAEGKEQTPHFLVGKDGRVQVFPGPITQEKNEAQLKSYQQAAVYYREQGDNARADYYDKLANDIQRQRLALEGQRVEQGWQRLNRPQPLYDIEQDETILTPPGTRPLPRQRQGGAGGIRGLLDETGGAPPAGGEGGGTHFLKDAQGRVRKVDQKTYDAYIKHYNLQY